VQDKNYFQLRNLYLAENFERNKKLRILQKGCEVDFTSVILQAFFTFNLESRPCIFPLATIFWVAISQFLHFFTRSNIDSGVRTCSCKKDG
jgi:hypothetical protein